MLFCRRAVIIKENTGLPGGAGGKEHKMKKRIAALLFAGILALAPAGGTAFDPTGGGYLADGKRDRRG